MQDWSSHPNVIPDIISLVIHQQYRSYWKCLSDEAKNKWIDDTSTPKKPQDTVSGEQCAVQSDSRVSKKKLSASEKKSLERAINTKSIPLFAFRVWMLPRALLDDSKTAKELEETEKALSFFRANIQKNWMYAYILFKIPHFYSGHVMDVEHLRVLLDRIVARARLPGREHLEGLKVLRSAWNVVDVGHVHLGVYKYMSKFFYLYILASGIGTVCLTVFSGYIDSSMTNFESNMTPTGALIFYLSVATTFVTAFNSYINPSSRWRQIRNITCTLESSIWQYRTRTGLYKIKLHDDDSSVSDLKDSVASAVETLIDSSDIGQSS